MTTFRVWVTIVLLGVSHNTALAASGRVEIVVQGDAAPRVRFGAERLNTALASAGYESRIVRLATATSGASRISLTTGQEAQDFASLQRFRLSRETDGSYRVAGFGDSGTLYGALELAKRVTDAGVKALGRCVDLEELQLSGCIKTC